MDTSERGPDHLFNFNATGYTSLDRVDESLFSTCPSLLGTGAGATTLQATLSEEAPSGIHEGHWPDGDPGPIQDTLELDGALNSQEPIVGEMDVTFDDFFRDNGAWRPPEPCTYCRRLRLQCFMLQTTSANPNPVTSCSSCVALFRQCSLAERAKRQPADFETSEPVINNLHGVNEELEVCPLVPEKATMTGHSYTVTIPTTPSKRPRSRSVRKTHLLRNWFSCHLDHPYPSEEERIALSQQSGLSRTQVSDWFSNARRRHRLSIKAVDKTIYPQGSPMPTPPMSNMTPFERWRHSPPDEEPASESAIEQALRTPLEGLGRLHEFDVFNTDTGPSSSSGGSAFNPYSPWPYPSSDSASSCHTYISSADGISLFSTSSHSIGSLNRQTGSAPPSTSARARTFRCTFCPRSFTKKYDWRRHESSVHLSNNNTPRWVCGIPLSSGQSPLIWRLSQREPECVFCGHVSPTEEHFRSHEFEACAGRADSDRAFLRKDHLWQHLYKFHGCRKWEGWKPNLNPLRRD
ncbi:hypothetical protein F5Y13DRAFT_8571 [Hypoxylon sp. FL1857]|nr:hypothetical protein F5Y13DRAFT_8571 [Hypoxylon sp. FL1857]